VQWTGANGLVPLLPVYTANLGADPAITGNFLAIVYVGLACGSVAAGWLSDRLQRRKALYVAVGVANVPVNWLMGRAANMGQLTVLMTLSGFLIGMGLSLLGILTGLFADRAERGRVFGLLGMTGSFGSVIGGLTIGPAADRWGYPTMLTLLALFYVLWPLLGSFLRDTTVTRRQTKAISISGEGTRLGGAFILLLIVTLLFTLGGFVSSMGRSLAMDELGLPSAAISSTTAVSGVIGLPLRPLIGRLSDRVGRKRLMVLCYLLRAVGFLALSAATSLWHFWVTGALLAIPAAARALGDALATDLLPRESLGVGMSLLSAVNWIAGIAGFAGTGHAIQHLGMRTTMIATASLPLIGILLLIPIRQTEHEQEG
jgi:MFS family permease